MNKNFKFFLVLFAVFFLLAVSSASAWMINEPIVPCGGLNRDGTPQPECTQCELLHLVDNLMDFILIAAAPILATFFFIIAGVFVMLGGAKPDMLATGKRMFSSAMFGIIIVMMAWLITNTLITTLIQPAVNQQSTNFSFDSTRWWELSCRTVGLRTTAPSVNPNPPLPPPAPPGTQNCQLRPNIVITPAQASYNNGDVIQVSVLAASGCTGFKPEVRVGPRTGAASSIDWSQGVVVGNPTMTSPCVNSVACAVINWTVDRFNTNTNSFQIRAVSDDGTGLCPTDASHCTQSLSSSFWIN